MEDLNKYFSYDPDSGIVTWKVNHGRKIRAGTRAGTQHGGYRRVVVNRFAIREHRLCFFLKTGRMPVRFIDHINGNGSDNRWSNLRECTDGENSQNRSASYGKENKSSRFIGVSWHQRDAVWRAAITWQKKTRHLGSFASEEDAFNAYLKAKAEIHLFNPIPRDV